MVTLRGRRVLVTGATGFIGSALARRLVRDGAEVHLLVRASSSPARLGSAWGRVTRHVGDLGDEASLAAAVSAARPEVVFHLAKEREGASFERQSAATLRLARVLRAHAPDLRRWVRTAHDAPSRADDAALASRAAALGLPVVTLELYLVYGPGQAKGDFPRGVLEGERPRRLSGSVKDFVWLDDVVEAYLLASHASGVEGLTIPIGTGQGRTEAEAAALLLRLLGSADAPPDADGPGAGHPADPSLARRLLRWTPRVLLEQGLARLAAGRPSPRPDAVLERRHMVPWLGEPGGRAARARPGSPRGPWSLVHSAAASFRKGDLEAAGRDADLFIGRLPGAAAGPAMKALLAAQRGDREETERWLEAAGPSGPEGWARALRGMMRARWGQHEAAREDLEATRRVERSAWASAERADAYNRVGLFWSALTELAHMRRAMPNSPEPELRASAIHLEQAQYEEAAACLARAARVAPADAAVSRQLARVHFVEGDLPSARRAIETACRLAPDDLSLRQERLRLCILLDDEKAFGPLLEQSWPPGVRDYWCAYVACRRKRYDESIRLFAAAEKACADPQLARTCAFYRHVARVLSQAPAPKPPADKELLIMGLGFRHPYQVSVEVLWALLGCQEFFSNLSDSTVADMLGLYGVPMRTIVFRRSDGQSTPCARIVMKAMKTLARGGVVTRGQPVYYGRLAYRLVKDCEARGIPCRVPPSVSISDFFPSLVGRVRGESLGLEVRDTNGLAGLDPRLGVVVYNFSSGERRREQAAAIRAQFAPEDPCWLMAGSGELEYEPAETTVAALEPALMRADQAVTVLLPCKG